MQKSDIHVLDNTAESHLENEIDNENVMVVRGDGVETASGRQSLNEDIVKFERRESFDEALSSSSEEERPSWGRNAAQNKFPSEAGSLGNTTQSPPTGNIRTSLHALQDASPIPQLRRIKSALSVLMVDGESMRHPPSPLASLSTGIRRPRSRGGSVTIRPTNMGMSHIVPCSTPIRELSVTHSNASFVT